jgi:arylsulfatase A-like enzyme
MLKCNNEKYRPWFVYAQDYTTHEAHGPFPRINKFADSIQKELKGIAWYKTSIDSVSLPPRYAELIKHYYRESCVQYDIQLAMLFDYLESSGVLDDTIVVFLSDHGEELFAHGWGGHAHTMWDEALHIPLAVHFPGKNARVEDRPVSIVDIAATVLGLPSFGNGMNLFSEKREHTYSEVEFNKAFDDLPLNLFVRVLTWWRKEAVVSGNLKMIKRFLNDGTTQVEYYDLFNDPHEQCPMLPSESLLKRYPQIPDVELYSSLWFNARRREDDVERVSSTME